MNNQTRTLAVVSLLTTLVVSFTTTGAQGKTSGSAPTYVPLDMEDIYRYGRIFDGFCPAFMPEQEAWVKTASENPHCRLAKVALLHREWQTAINEYSLAIKQDSHNAVALAGRAIANQMSLAGKEDDPLSLNRGLLKPDRNNMDRIMTSAVADYTAAIKEHPDCGRLFRNRGVTLAANDHMKEGLVDCEHSVTVSPNDLVCIYTLAFFYDRTAQPAKAAELLTRGLLLSPGAPLLLTERGKMYLRLEQYDKAIKDETYALARDPNNPRAYNERGGSYLMTHQFKAANADFSRASALMPKSPDFLISKAVSESYLDDHKACIRDATAALKCNYPNEHVCYHVRGMAFEALGQYREALSDFNHALKTDPHNVNTLISRAKTLNFLGERFQAMKDINEALAIEPQSSAALGIRAAIMASTGNYDQSVQDLYQSRQELTKAPQQSNKIDPKTAAVERTVMSRQDLENRKQMQALFRRGVLPSKDALAGEIGRYNAVLTVDPASVESYYNRGVLQWCAGDTKSALNDFARCKSLAPTGRLGMMAQLLSRVCGNSSLSSPVPFKANLTDDPLLKEIASFLDHRSSADQLLSFARNSDDQALFRFFIGMDALNSNRPEVARSNLKWVQDHANMESDEYSLSTVELAQIPQ